MDKSIIKYDDYLKSNNDRSNTSEYEPPETAVIPQPGDKMIAYMKSQFSAQIPYFHVGIRSVNPDLPDYKNDGTK
jgi:hypothetical protein